MKMNGLTIQSVISANAEKMLTFAECCTVWYTNRETAGFADWWAMAEQPEERMAGEWIFWNWNRQKRV